MAKAPPERPRPAPDAAPLVGLAPIVDARSQILILGSFPSSASLRAGQYYAHRQNQFWRILGEVLQQPLADMEYAARQAALLQAGLAVWDVYRRCRRDGSLDSAIRDTEANDFATLAERAPRLRGVCFNGQTAGRFAPVLHGLGYRTRVAPSTSPAYTLAIALKQAAWRTALAELAAS
jgi:TDG/mug DNA glycosylase family protein